VSVALDMSALLTLLSVVVVMNSWRDPIRLVVFGSRLGVAGIVA
jgi:hypothetical protein